MLCAEPPSRTSAAAFHWLGAAEPHRHIGSTPGVRPQPSYRPAHDLAVGPAPDAHGADGGLTLAAAKTGPQHRTTEPGLDRTRCLVRRLPSGRGPAECCG